MPVRCRRQIRLASWHAGTVGVIAILTLLLAPGGTVPGGTAEPPLFMGAHARLVPGTPSSATSTLSAAENSLASGKGLASLTARSCNDSESTFETCQAPGKLTPVPSAGSYNGWGNDTPYLAHHPSPRWGAAMVYDNNSSDDYVVLFGGDGPNGVLGDTWIFRAGNWTNITPAVLNAADSPPARYGAAMAYDSSDGYVVLFGGASAPYTGSNAPLLNDTWKFVHGNWTELCGSCSPGITEPGPRLESSASNDPSDSGVVLFGGLAIASAAYTPLNDTWVFSGGTWAHHSPNPSPSPRFAAGMSYVPTGGPVVLFGGCSRTSTATGLSCAVSLNDSWTFSTGAWTESAAASSSPGPRSAFGLASSYGEGPVLAFGGVSAAGSSLNETWQLESGSWTDLTDTLLSSPSPREDVAMTFDPASGANYFVLFGGWNSTYLGETWLYPSPFSPLRVSAPVAAPAITDAGLPITLTVSIAGGAGGYDISWFGLPQGCASHNATSLTCRPATPVYGYESSYNVFVRVRDYRKSIVWSAWTTVVVNSKPTVAIAPLSDVYGIVPWNVSLQAVTTGGTSPFAFVWDFGDESANVSGNPVTHEYNTPGNFTASVLATDALGVSSSAPLPPILIRAPLAVQLTVEPNSVTAGSSIVVRANATGGFPPYSYAWTGLPKSCSVSGGPSISCSLQSTGTYVISVDVTDTMSDRATNSSTLTVGPSTSAAVLEEWEWVGAGAAGVVAVVAAVWMIRRSKRRGPRPVESPRASPPGSPPSG